MAGPPAAHRRKRSVSTASTAPRSPTASLAPCTASDPGPDPGSGTVSETGEKIFRRFAGTMRVAFLTTSYPRDESDAAGAFMRDAVDDLRAAGLEIDVVSPATFDHYGIAYGAGIMGN